jgi:NAD(P)-dependent dehydrogenase (short-subunit alcohol dehydrogenase family)
MAALQGKVAVITGGSSGIGLAAAKRFVAEGGFVHVYATQSRKGNRRETVGRKSGRCAEQKWW